MKQSTKQFWTLFRYGSCDAICSKHKTLKDAKRAADTCEQSGGAKHRIAEVRWITTKK